jgi:hypothetical protein
LILVFREIEPVNRPGAKKVLAEAQGEFGLTGARRADEQERTAGTLPGWEPHFPAHKRLRHSRDHLILAANSRPQVPVEAA